jgi:L-alanine-DL-glutamate epimerase-like enolase superfamily enzyme
MLFCAPLGVTRISKIRDILRDPPRAGWSRRRFLAAIASAAAVPLLTDTPAWARARQSAGRIKIIDLKLQRLRLEKDWGSYDDYVGNRRGGRTGGGAITEIHTDQGLIGIGPAISPAALDAVKGYLAGKDPFDVNRHTALLYGGGREGGVRIAGGRPTGVEIALWDLIGKAANQPLYKLWGGTKDRIMPYSSMFRLGPARQRAETALKLKAEGWKAIKLKSHYQTMREDVAQIEAVRSACGPDFIITTDANKAGFTVCDVHLVASWPNAPLLEVGNEAPEGAYEHSYAVFEQPIALTKDGYFNMPTGAGLGVAIRKDLYEK